MDTSVFAQIYPPTEDGRFRGPFWMLIPNWRMTKTLSVSHTVALVPENCLSLIPMDYHHFR